MKIAKKKFDIKVDMIRKKQQVLDHYIGSVYLRNASSELIEILINLGIQGKIISKLNFKNIPKNAVPLNEHQQQEIINVLKKYVIYVPKAEVYCQILSENNRSDSQDTVFRQQVHKHFNEQNR